MSPLTARIVAEIQSSGPMPFERFMEVALYFPGLGYYTRPRDPFGRQGDFYTAEQLQPVFGRLIASVIRELGVDRVVELGAGRGEMRDALSSFNYLAVDVGRGALPGELDGLVFCNEFFDALPVGLQQSDDGETWREVRIGSGGDRLHFHPPPSGALRETHPNLEPWVQRIAASLKRGYLLVIDYGYTGREAARFPRGTLMSYRNHAATEDLEAILRDPGERDITAHVPFTLLESAAERAGFTTLRFESLAQFLMRAGQPDEFASALAADSAVDSQLLRLQLKTLLFSMGESFRVLLLSKAA